jgi:hypothetical protein
MYEKLTGNNISGGGSERKFRLREVGRNTKDIREEI